MLTKRLIKQTLKVKRHKVVDLIEKDNLIEIYMDVYSKRRLQCGSCGTFSPQRDRLKERRIKHVPLWGIPVVLVYRPARVKCSHCQKVRVEDIPFAQGKSRMTKGLVWTLSGMGKLLPWQTVAEMFKVNWGTVRAAVKQAVEYGLAHRKIGRVIYIGVDEVSSRKGHKYVTVVYDLTGKRMLWMGKDRTKETLETFFQEHGQALKGTLKGVCCDMWQPYIDVVTKHVNDDVVMVFDKFHIIQHLNKAVDEVRKEEARELKKDNPELLKKTRYIWLKNPENLTDNQRSRLGYLEKLNLKVNRAYLLKESFRDFWDYSYPKSAKKYLAKWFWWATHSRLKPLRDFARMLRKHQEGIMNYFKCRITNGITEGMNNKAKTVIKRCYGFRTVDTLKLAFYHSLGKLPEPESLHRFV
jgi:transposase